MTSACAQTSDMTARSPSGNGPRIPRADHLMTPFSRQLRSDEHAHKFRQTWLDGLDVSSPVHVPGLVAV